MAGCGQKKNVAKKERKENGWFLASETSVMYYSFTLETNDILRYVVPFHYLDIPL